MRPRPLGLLAPFALSLAVATSYTSALSGQAPIPRTPPTEVAVVVDTMPREVDPGASVTVRVIVQDGESARDVVLDTRVPDGWRLLSAPVEMHVARGSRAIRFVQISVPRDAVAGTYRIVHVVRAAGLDSDVEAQTLVVVRPRRSIAVSLIEEPYFAASGSTYRAIFLVSNKGNVRTRVRLRATAAQDLSTKIDTLSELKPGESRQVGVVVDAGTASATDESRHHVSLVAEADGGLSDDDQPTPEAVASVRVVPRSDDAGMPWFSIPMLFRMFSTQTQGACQFACERSHSFELSGVGPVAEGSRTMLELLVRGPRPDRSFLGDRDEYRVGLAGQNFSFRIGDQMLRLTPLTEPSSFSTGASTGFNFGKWSTGGFFAREREMGTGRTERAAFLGFRPAEQLSLSANLFEDNQLGGGTLGSVFGRMMLTARSLLEAEEGVGLRGTGTGARATLVRTAGDHGWVAFELRHLRTDSTYRSSLRGMGQDLASLTLRPTSWFRVSGRAESETNTNGTILFISNNLQSAPKVNRSSDLTVELAGLLAAGLKTFSEIGTPTALLGVAASTAEQSQWVRFSASAGPLAVVGTAERGTLAERSIGRIHPFAATRAQGSLRVGTHLSFGGFLERATGQRRYMIEPRTIVTAGGSSQIQFGSLSILFSAATAPASRFIVMPDSALMVPGSTAWMDGTVGYRLASGRSISLRVRTISSGSGRPTTTTARLAYNMPIRLPIGRSRSQGRVTGRVYDAESGAGVSNALVRIGDRAALTDDDGRVAFGGLPPNRYPVFVDLGARQADGSGFQDEGLEVTSQPGRTTDIGIRVVRMGRIVGRVRLLERAGSSLQPAEEIRYRVSGGVPGIIISLMNGAEERRVMTGADGSFELRDARPGLWRIVVSRSQLPAEHSVEGDSIQVVDLVAGATRSVEVNVVPRLRKILPLDVVPGGRPPAVGASGGVAAPAASTVASTVAPTVASTVASGARIAMPKPVAAALPRPTGAPAKPAAAPPAVRMDRKVLSSAVRTKSVARPSDADRPAAANENHGLLGGWNVGASPFVRAGAGAGSPRLQLPRVLGGGDGGCSSAIVAKPDVRCRR